jgi:hypothetical protein
MKSVQPNINLDIKSRFKAIFCQPNLMFAILCLFAFAVIRFLGTSIIKINISFALFSIVGIILILFILSAVLLIKSDTTESIEIHKGDNKVIIKSPSRQLMPAIINKLLENTARPDKLIPRGIDLRADPAEFQPLSPEQQENIVKKEVEVAILGEVDSGDNSS